MDQFVNSAYDVTSQLFGSGSGIPWWAWALVVVAITWKMVLPERKTVEDRDAAMVATMTGSEDGKSKKKDKKKK